ncbi:TPA: ABC transporter permease, partial [Burkholderia multivorans]|nr:ABC transporter permease [Burkholderia multivorans]
MSRLSPTVARDEALVRRPCAPPRAPCRDPLRAWRIAGIALPFAALALIEFGVRRGGLPANLVPAPSEIFDTLARMGAARVARHVGASALRV